MNISAQGEAMSVFFVGDSHLGAVVNAYHARRAQGRAAGVPEFVWLSQFKPHFDEPFAGEPALARLLRPVRGRHGDRRLHPALKGAVRKATAGDRRALMVMSIAGNHHNQIGLLNHPRKFDFVLPSAPDLPLLGDHEVVPAAFIEATLASRLAYALRLLATLARTAQCRVVHLQSPPPNPSAEHIARHPDEMFKDAVEQYGVAPASVRLKLWKLHSALFRKACDELGIPFVPPPPEAVDPSGFLVERAWGRDATHASDWYGELVISQVEALAEADRGEP
jgi:hypothetical protein